MEINKYGMQSVVRLCQGRTISEKEKQDVYFR